MYIYLDEFLKTKPKRNSKYYFNIDDIIYYKNEKIKIVSQFKKGGDKYYHVICMNCNNDFDLREPNIFHKRGCAYCKNKKIKIGYNDVATTNPILANYMLNKDDAYKYSQNSNQRINWKCDCCGTIIENKQISLVNNFGLCCPKCNDGISFPNRIMYNILLSLKIDFETEKSFEWSNHKKYDFYIPSVNCIIEMQGGFHNESKFGKDVSIVKNNDKYKKEIAQKNGIENYITINAYVSIFKKIEENIIESDLSNLFIIDNIDWKECYNKSIKSIIPQICEIWNSDKNITSDGISKIFKINIATVSKYLKIGNELGLCSYNPVDGHKRASNTLKKEVICKNTGEIFKSAKEAALCYHLLSTSNIRECCLNKRKYAGKDSDTGDLLSWAYII